MNKAVGALAVFDDGAGPALYAGGVFTSAGGVSANRIARWDGSGWSALGSGIDAGPFGTTVYALASFNDGADAHPDLYVGGDFSSAGGIPSLGIAQWFGGTTIDTDLERAGGLRHHFHVGRCAGHDTGTTVAPYKELVDGTAGVTRCVVDLLVGVECADQLAALVIRAESLPAPEGRYCGLLEHRESEEFQR